MSYPAYAEMKASEVEWFNELPATWQPMRLKYLLRKKITDGPHTTPVFIDDGIPFLSVDGIQDGELVFEGCRYVSEEDHSAYKVKALPEAGDILLGKAASTGKVARVKVDFEFSIWSPLALIKPNKTTVDPSFLEYALKSHSSQAQVDVLCTSNTQKNISMDDIPLVVFALPELPEQQQIAAFLDRKTAEVDAVLRLKERQLELLAEKRQALISHAVTRGLDPTAPLKPSGVPWLGDVPGHWEVTPLKFLASFAGGGTPAKENLDFWAGDIPWVSPKDMKSEWIEDSEDHISEEALATSATSMVAPGTVLIVVRSGILKHTIPIAINSVPVSLNQDMKAVIFGKRLEARYFAYLVRGCQNALLTLWRKAGATVESIEQEYLANTECPVPPVPEQQAIVAYLDRETARMDRIAQAIRAQIGKVREYRQALISAAVTGKIDVRGV